MYSKAVNNSLALQYSWPISLVFFICSKIAGCLFIAPTFMYTNFIRSNLLINLDNNKVSPYFCLKYQNPLVSILKNIKAIFTHLSDHFFKTCDMDNGF